MKIAVARSKIEQTQALANVLPNGRAWASKNKPYTVLRKFLSGLAVEYWRLENEVESLIRNMNPENADELISDWEESFGIPDGIFTITDDLAKRQRNVMIKKNDLHVQTNPDFVKLAALFGYEVFINNGTASGIFPLKFPILFTSSKKKAKNTLICKFTNRKRPPLFPLKFPIQFSSNADIGIVEKLFQMLKPATANLIFIYKEE